MSLDDTFGDIVEVFRFLPGGKCITTMGLGLHTPCIPPQGTHIVPNGIGLSGHSPKQCVVQDTPVQKGPTGTRMDLVNVKEFLPHVGILLPDGKVGNANGCDPGLPIVRQERSEKFGVLTIALINVGSKGRHVLKSGHVPPICPVGVGAEKDGDGRGPIEPVDVGGAQDLEGFFSRTVLCRCPGVVIKNDEIPFGRVLFKGIKGIIQVIWVLITRIGPIIVLFDCNVVVILDVVIIGRVGQARIVSKDQLTHGASSKVVTRRTVFIGTQQSRPGVEFFVHAISRVEEIHNRRISVQTRILNNQISRQCFHEPW
mmetsp:Transcript_1509/g.3733  ORF Transcript_1509/g.3733 Transcript_1509/m.3733 type:complete len:313 (+) Transcript_1509:1306-2244(+)